MAKVSSKRPTQSDVARRAGVSRATVSLVLNGLDGGRVPISAETRQRVLRALRDLDYTPNAAAQMLARGRNQIIGVFTYESCFPYERDNFYYQFLLGIEREAGRQNFNLLLQTRGISQSQPRIFADGINSLHLADGAVLLGAYPDREELKRLVRQGYPFVFIGRREVPGHPIDWVASDYRTVSYEATKLLLSLGHRQIAFLCQALLTESAEDRILGCREAVGEEEGAQFTILDPQVALQERRLVDALRELAASALICANQDDAVTGLEQLRGAGVRVPDDISVVCLADCDGELPVPVRLTYVRLQRVLIGETAVRLLVQRIAGLAEAPQQLRIPAILVPGESTAPVRASRMI